MNPRFRCDELIHGSKPSQNGVRTDFAEALKRALAMALSILLCYAQLGDGRICDGL
jgi:hypothetical protein